MTGLLQRVSEQPAVLLLLDFDGTLSEIVATPEEAVPYPDAVASLREMARKPGYTVGILSGRSLADVRRRVGINNLVYGGNHGLEIAGPGIDYLHPEARSLMPAIAEACQRLTAGLAGIPGAFVENKTFTLTAHYRQTPETCHGKVFEAFDEATAHLVASNRCRVTVAKAALELRPAIDWNKGFALEYVRRRLCPSAYPLYIGDDATDEDAFRTAQDLGGSGVFVGPADAPTCARYNLSDPSAVQDFLHRLAAC